MVQQTDTVPWYKQFWPWFLMLPLFVTVVLSGYMLYTAFTKGDSVVTDNYYKNGLAINAVIDDLAYAKTLGIQAQIALEGERIQLQLAADKVSHLTSIALQFSHPADKSRDLKITMLSAGNGLFVAKRPHLTQGKWYVDVINSQGTHWRLKTAVHYPFERVTITP